MVRVKQVGGLYPNIDFYLTELKTYVVVVADFSNFFLRFLSRFDVVNESQPLTPRKYPPALSFHTALNVLSSTSNCTPLLLSQFSNTSVFSPLSSSSSEFSSLELRSQRLDSSKFDLSELESD